MGKWMKTLRKYRHLGLIFGLIAIGLAMWIISGAWTVNIVLTGGYVAIAPTISIFWLLFMLGISAGINLTTYVILELSKED